MPKALIVDDEPDILELIELTLTRMDVEVITAENLQHAKALLASTPVNFCLTDMRLPDGNGIDLVHHIQQHYRDTPVAMITAHGNMEAAIAALKGGAFDFVSKPVDLQVLRNLVTTALKTTGSVIKPERRSRHILLGDAPAMKAIRGAIVKLARSQAPVYISGESGTGKELIAHLIHEKGPRADKPFVPVNCGAIPEQLMESEFFGHRKGSFTGANSDKTGLFQAADGGTLFLDEIADLPLNMQVKLLRAIQEKRIRPVGAQQERPVDVRILSATHKNLGEMVNKGEFRQDLFYRINVIELQAPSLRERPQDIPILTEHLLRRLAKQNQTPPTAITTASLDALKKYPFPGNVRELENILERAMTLCEENTIHPEDLALPDSGEALDADSQAEELDAYLDIKEREAIINALEQTRYNKTAAAKLLGISFRALRYRLKKLKID